MTAMQFVPEFSSYAIEMSAFFFQIYDTNLMNPYGHTNKDPLDAKLFKNTRILFLITDSVDDTLI